VELNEKSLQVDFSEICHFNNCKNVNIYALHLKIRKFSQEYIKLYILPHTDKRKPAFDLQELGHTV